MRARRSEPEPDPERRGGHRASDDDRQRVRRAQAGDIAAFEELVRAHSPRIYRMLVRILSSTTDAEDVTQEAFVKAWRALPGFRGDAQFSTWLFRIAVNEANRRAARDSRRQTVPIDDDALAVPDRTDSPAAQAESAELQAFLERCVAELPPDYRAAVVLRDIEGLTTDEAADHLGLAVPNFKSRLHRGRMQIRRRVEERFGAD